MPSLKKGAAHASASNDEATKVVPLVHRPEREWWSADQIVPSEVACLWHPYILLGAPSLLTGRGGLGKSTLLTKVAALGSTGSLAPDGVPFMAGGDGDCVPFDTAILCAEDPYDAVVVPRIKAMGGNESRIVLLNTNPWPNIATERDIALLRDKLERIKAEPGRNLRLLIIDGWKDFIVGKNTWDDNQVRPIMLGMSMLARFLNIALVGLVHPTRDDPKSIAGSEAFYSNSRSVLAAIAQPTPEHPKRSVMIHHKHNWTRKGAAFAYETDDEGRAHWLGPVNEEALIVDDADHDPIGREDAREFLRGLLAEGPVDVQQVDELGRKKGLQIRTLRRARKDIGAISTSVGFGKGRTAKWSLKPLS